MPLLQKKHAPRFDEFRLRIKHGPAHPAAPRRKSFAFSRSRFHFRSGARIFHSLSTSRGIVFLLLYRNPEQSATVLFWPPPGPRPNPP